MSSPASFRACAAFAALTATASAQDSATPPNLPASAGPTQTLAARGLPAGGSQSATSSPGRMVVLYTNIATSPTSDVPGLAPAKFQASTSSTAIFDRPWVSPNGAHWLITADTDLATTEDEVLVLNGAVVGREGTPAPWEAGQNWGPLDARIGLNDAGEYAFTINVAPSSVNDDYTVKVSAGPTYTVFTREGSAITALPGATWDDTIDGPVLLNDGRVSVQGDGIDGAGVVTTNDDEILVLDNVILAREGITVPAGQDAGATNAWENFDFEDVWIDAAGANVLIKGDLLGATTSDNVLVYNGNVVLQEGVIIPGSSFVAPIAATGIAEVSMDSVGNWMARGDNTGGQDWVVRNGAVLLATGDPVASSVAVRHFSGPMNEAQEVPPTGSPATGTIRVLVNTSTNTLTYQVAFTGLTGIESAAHIHGPAAPGVNAPVLYALPLGSPKVGVINYLESEEAAILSGLTYVNVHTDLFPGGEIRGQIVPTVELWDGPSASPETFYAITSNGSNWAVMGTTTAPDNVNGVVVLNGQHVIVRERDPIDLDGNGLYDDDSFFRTFGNDDLVLLADGTLYFTATIQNAAGSQTGQGFFVRQGGNLQQAFCFGDGSGTACPCGNTSAVGALAGCLNSLGVGGRVDSSGIASISADTLLLSGTNMPNSSALYFQGTAQLGGGAGAVFGDGLRCAGGSVIRLATKFNAAGGSQFPALGDPTVSVRGLVTSPGSRTYQIWYRNAAAFCTISTFNLTNGIEIGWGA